MLTLSIHKVRDGHRVQSVGLGSLGLEHDIGMALGAGTHVFLAELLDLGLDGSASLWQC